MSGRSSTLGKQVLKVAPRAPAAKGTADCLFLQFGGRSQENDRLRRQEETDSALDIAELQGPFDCEVVAGTCSVHI